MTRLFQSPWIASGVGMILFLLTMVFTWHPKMPKAPGAISPPRASGPSWTFYNPEVEQLVSELKREKEGLAEKEKQLNQLAQRLQAERLELNQVTQTVHTLQSEFDRNVVRVEEQESANLKRLAKVYANMAPDGAVQILKQMDEVTLVKILTLMKDSETSGILEAMGKQGEAEAKRAASLTERLRLSLPKGSATSSAVR